MTRRSFIASTRSVEKIRALQIRRGWYLIGKPYRAREVSDAAIANAVVRPSYLSLEWALQYHALIPEATFQPTSVTTLLGIRFEALDRLFLYHHVARDSSAATDLTIMPARRSLAHRRKRPCSI